MFDRNTGVKKQQKNNKKTKKTKNKKQKTKNKKQKTKNQKQKNRARPVLLKGNACKCLPVHTDRAYAN